MKVIVFFGPSIGRQTVASLIAATHAPPVRRGDLKAARGHDIIVILDGEFGQSLSVSPKEILVLLEDGAIVIGASSMGALRASELDGDGMIGIGWVYERFRRARIRRDDDVALQYSPVDFTPITVPMVDIQWWTDRAAERGLISRRDAGRILRAARRIFFAERTEQRLRDALRGILDEDVLDTLWALGDGAVPSIKSADAEAALRFAASLAPSHAPTFRFTEVTLGKGEDHGDHTRSKALSRLNGIAG
jgi:hypothetical protein